MHVESEAQQKSEGSFVSGHREKVELAHVEACRPSRIPSACAADMATVRAEVEGTMDEARHTRANFEMVDRGAMVCYAVCDERGGVDVKA
jgi:hypothetical protein